MSTTETVIEIIVFIAMIVTSIFYIISSKPWFSIIPAITAVAHLNMIYDKEKTRIEILYDNQKKRIKNRYSFNFIRKYLFWW